MRRMQSGSRPTSAQRPSASRAFSTDSAPSIRDPFAVALPDGQADISAVNLLPNLLQPPKRASSSRRSVERHRTTPEILAEMDDEEEVFGRHNFAEEDEEIAEPPLPWYKTPSPWWMLGGTLLAAMAMSITLAPRLEIYTRLACKEIRPEYDAIEIDTLFLPSQTVDWPTHLGSVTMMIPRPSKKCQEDPHVHEAVAKLGATISTVMGTLSCLTAGFWGQFSDRHGRKLVLAISVSGVLATDAVIILVSLLSQSLPFGYRFLVVGPIVEGALGGIATGAAASHAYLADTTSPQNRSRFFSLTMGLLFCGLALGPTLGGLLISKTGNLLIVFYIAASMHLLYLLMTLFILPESLTKEQQIANQVTYKEQVIKEEKEWERRKGTAGFAAWITERVIKRAFFFARPLTILLPTYWVDVTGRKRRNWNLTSLAVGYAAVMMIMGSYQFKLQFASFAFKWTSEQLGYWLSIIGVARATYLVIILPFLIRTFNGQKTLPPAPVEPVIEASSINSQASSPRTSVRSLDPMHIPHSPSFDLLVARVSLVIELLANVSVALFTTSPVWITSTIIGSFGAGFGPSVQSLALELYKEAQEEAEMIVKLDASDEDIIGSTRHSRASSSVRTVPPVPANPSSSSSNNAGQVFGALSVIQALCSQILGPLIYGFTFWNTIETTPQAIFWLSTSLLAFSLLSFATMRLRVKNKYVTERDGEDFEAEAAPLLDLNTPEARDDTRIGAR